MISNSEFRGCDRFAGPDFQPRYGREMDFEKADQDEDDEALPVLKMDDTAGVPEGIEKLIEDNKKEGA